MLRPLVLVFCAFIVSTVYSNSHTISWTQKTRGVQINCTNGYDDRTDCDIRCINDQACYESTIYCPAAAQCNILCKGVESCYHATILSDAVEDNTQTLSLKCDGNRACNRIQIYANNSNTVRAIAKQSFSLQGHRFEFSNVQKVDLECTQPSACGNDWAHKSYELFTNVENVKMNCTGDKSCLDVLLFYDNSANATLKMQCDGDRACQGVLHWPANTGQKRKSSINCVTNETQTSSCAMEMFVEEGFFSKRMQLNCNEWNNQSCAGSFYHCGSDYKESCVMTYSDNEWVCDGTCPASTTDTSTSTTTSTAASGTTTSTTASGTTTSTAAASTTSTVAASTTSTVAATTTSTAAATTSKAAATTTTSRSSNRNFKQTIVTTAAGTDGKDSIASTTSSASVSSESFFHKHKNLLILIGIIVGCLCLGFLCGVFLVSCCRKRQEADLRTDADRPLLGNVQTHGTFKEDDTQA